MRTTANIKYMQNIKTLLNSPLVKQLAFMIGVAGSVALGIVLYMSIQEPTYRPLDYQVNSQNMAAIVDTLEKAGIQYKMNDQDGVIYVPVKDMQLAKIKLSAAGVARDDGFNFSYLNEQNSIGNSQFMENARYIRALESDLSKTISAIEGVSSARVHIAIPQNNVFADENGRPTASVVLSMAPGLMSDKEKMRAIVQIVASSVPGLDPKDVAITDQYGHYLSGALDQDGMYSAEQLNYQNNIQRYYEKRIETMIMPIIGENKITVRVHADVDYTRQEESKEAFDPNDHVVRSEQSVSEQTSSGGASGAPGALANTPPSPGNDKSGGTSSAGDSKNQSTKNYEVGKSITYKNSSYPKITSLSVAVVVDNESTLDPTTKKYVSKPLDKDKISKITELVKATMGYDEKRGDRVTVINSSFNVPKDDGANASIPLWDQIWFWDVVKKILGITAGFGFLFLIYRNMSSLMKSSAQAAPVGITFVEDKDPSNTLSPEMLALKQEQINRLKEMANRDPNRVALVIKNWVGK